MEQHQNITGTAIATLPPAERAAIALGSSNTEQQLLELVANSKGIVTVIDKAGREEAHGAAMALRGVRTTIAKTGKAAREDAQAFSKAVIAEEARLIAIVQPEEDRVLSLRDGYDAKVAAEKAERDRKEAERKASLQAKVDAIRNLPLGMDGETAAEIDTEIEALNQFVPGEEFMEYADAARDAAQAAITAMTTLRDRQAAKEAEAAELERQRTENARIAAEQEAERQRLAAVAAEQAAALKAEQDRFAVEQKAAADRIAAEQAERDRVAVEQQRQLAEQQAAFFAQQQAAADKMEADRAALQAERDALAAEKLASAEAEAQRFIDSTPKVEYPPLTTEQAGLPAQNIDQTVIGLPDAGLAAAIANEDADISECAELIDVGQHTPEEVATLQAAGAAPLELNIIGFDLSADFVPDAKCFTHASTYEAADTIDALLFSGAPAGLELQSLEWFLNRWTKQIAEIRAEDQ